MVSRLLSMIRMRTSLLLLSVLTSAACGVDPVADNASDPSEPSEPSNPSEPADPADPEPPAPPPLAPGEARIVFPPTAASATTSATFRVRGTANASAVFVNGELATSTDGFATWTAELPLEAGSNEIVISTDAEGAHHDGVASALVEQRAIAGRIPIFTDQNDRVFLGFAPGRPELLSERRFHAIERFDLATLTATDLQTQAQGFGSLAGDVILDGGRGGEGFGLDIFDAATGELRARSLLSSAPVGDFAFLPLVDGVTASGEVISLDRSAMFAFDPVTGTRRLISGHGRGTGFEPWDRFANGTVDRANNRVLIAYQTNDVTDCRVPAIDLATGDRSCAYTTEQFQYNTGLALHGTTLFLMSSATQPGGDLDARVVILAVDLATGAMRTLSAPAAGVPMDSIDSTERLIYDAAHDLLILSTRDNPLPVLIDPVSGQRVVPAVAE